ncbi:MAG: phage late control D family protein, partial [Ilumatobacteraceae bacterium]
MPSDTLVRPSAAVKIDGTALTSQVLDRVVRLRAELSFGQASRLQMTVVLYDGWESVFKIGATYEIGLDPGTGTPQPVLKGEITALAVEADKSEKSLIITGHDKSHRLGNNVKVVTHVEKSYGDIIGQIASAAGLTPKVHAALSTPRFPHIVQAASDLAFVADIARRTGMEFGVEGNELRVHPRTAGATVTLEMGEVLRSFEARYTTSERPTGVQVTGWDAASKQTIVATDEGELRTSMGSVPVVPANPQPRFGARQVNTWQGALTSIEEAKSVAKGIARRMTSHELSGEGETIGLPTIVPGCMVGITGIDAQWNGSYYVTSVEHLYAREAYVTRFTVGGLNDDGLVDLVAGPASHSVLSALPAGVTIGIVTNTKDTNNQHKSGHVKVKFPYLNDSESWWARVATIGA